LEEKYHVDGGQVLRLLQFETFFYEPRRRLYAIPVLCGILTACFCHMLQMRRVIVPISKNARYNDTFLNLETSSVSFVFNNKKQQQQQKFSDKQNLKRFLVQNYL
jgi:hypothetical protein